MINGMFIMSFSKSLVAQQAPPSVSNRNTKGSNTRTLNVSFKFPLPPPKKARQILYQSDIIYYSKLILIRVNCKLHF